MKRLVTLLLVSVVCLVIFVGIWAVLAHPVRADDTKPAVAALSGANPVVAAFPYQTDTEYEQDPFDQTRLRRSRTEVSRILIVHADGTQEIKSTK